jgi:hypothetical protein
MYSSWFHEIKGLFSFAPKKHTDCKNKLLIKIGRYDFHGNEVGLFLSVGHCFDVTLCITLPTTEAHLPLRIGKSTFCSILIF